MPAFARFSVTGTALRPSHIHVLFSGSSASQAEKGFWPVCCREGSFDLWMIGFRYGEALNPGPASCATVTFAVINPTTILDKEWQIQQVGADVLLASETSANQKVQKIMSSKLRGLGFRCMWGAPAADRFHNTTGQHMLSRGWLPSLVCPVVRPCIL